MQSSTPFALCRLLGGGEGAAVVGGGLLSRVEQLSLGEAVGPGDRPGLCRGILGVLRSVEGGCRNVVPGRKCPYNLDRLTDPTRSRHAANPPKIMFGSRNPLGVCQLYPIVPWAEPRRLQRGDIIFLDDWRILLYVPRSSRRFSLDGIVSYSMIPRHTGAARAP